MAGRGGMAVVNDENSRLPERILLSLMHIPHLHPDLTNTTSYKILSREQESLPQLRQLDTWENR